MERLTIKDKRTKNGIRLPGYCSPYEERVFNKLYQLEDLEEELGIDLLTLGKALINGVYCKGIPYILRGICIHTKDNIGIGFCDNRKFFNEIPVLHLWSDYGKTWSLRKEDLEDEKED